MLRKSSNGGIRRLITPGLALALVSLMALAVPAGAAPQYFDIANSAVWDAATENWGAAPGGPYDAAWAAGNTAVLEGAAGGSVAVDSVSAAGITFDTTGYTLAGGSIALTGSGAMTIASGKTATVNSALTGTSGVLVDGGGTVNFTGVSTISGGGDGSRGLIVGATTAGNTVNLSNGGTMGTISTNRRSLYIGSSSWASGTASTGNNSVTISTPGDVLAPSFNASGNGGRATIGYASSGNSLTVNNGAYLAQTPGGGTNTWDIGVLDGANSNSILVSGAGSTIFFGSNQFVNIGAAGSSNSVTVNAGGLFKASRFGLGTNGGDNNYMLVTGSGSVARGNAGTNAWFEIGAMAGATGNNFRVENGGALHFGGSGTSRRMGIGSVATSDNNYILVSGATSTANIVHTGIPLAIGGVASGVTMTDGGTGNHLDIYSGATLDMDNIDSANLMVPIGSTAIVLLGTDSAMNLGNGTGISTAYVGATLNFAQGVYIKNADGRLNINSGRLVAGVAGNLVSGAGQVNLIGDAYFATDLDATIASAIIGAGDVTKEGIGKLTMAANAYTGDTTIAAGTLSLAGLLSDASSVVIADGAIIDLSHGQVDTIASLIVDGVAKFGTFAGGSNSWITGSGSLYVVPEPATMSLLVLGGIAMISRRRRVA